MASFPLAYCKLLVDMFSLIMVVILEIVAKGRLFGIRVFFV